MPLSAALKKRRRMYFTSNHLIIKSFLHSAVGSAKAIDLRGGFEEIKSNGESELSQKNSAEHVISKFVTSGVASSPLSSPPIAFFSLFHE